MLPFILVDPFTLPMPLPAIGAALFGSLIGSFFNVVIYRMPRGESVAWPPSKCPQCGRGIKPLENIPILSWLMLRGKCAGCSLPISIQYPLVEAFTAMWAVLLTTYLVCYQPQAAWDFRIAFLYLGLCTIPITVIDLRHYLIPDLLNYPGLALGIAASLLPGGLTWSESLLGAGLSGGFLFGVGFIAEKLLKKEAMGLGDVKLLAMTGALFGLSTSLLGLLFAAVLGTVLGLPLMWFGRLNEQRHLPFGPFICVGVLIAAVAGEPLLNWYWSLLNF
jgi:leader peptidase (prepilin peptidase) / N-methyltransferase